MARRIDCTSGSGEHLASSLTRAAAHASLERSTGAFVHQVLHPQPSPIAVLFRWMRLPSS
jgi:hypothetical protein